jgi:hypothetical protein
VFSLPCFFLFHPVAENFICLHLGKAKGRVSALELAVDVVVHKLYSLTYEKVLAEDEVFVEKNGSCSLL